MPVKLIALAEGALTGFTDEIFDIPHVTAARELFIDIPGEESERLAELAASTRPTSWCSARPAGPEFSCRPLLPHAVRDLVAGRDRAQGGQEPPLVPRALVHSHDIYDRWVELFGDGIEAFYPCCAPTTSATSAPSAAPTASIPRRCAHSRSARRGRLPAE